MAAFSSIALGVVAAASVGSAIYSMSQEPPSIPPPPPPASYYSYDEYGEPAGEQVWDSSKNAYIYKPKPLTEEQKQELATRQDLRNKNLGYLNQTPEEWVKSAEEYAATFADVMHTDVDKRYAQRKSDINEEMQARGLTGISLQVI